jgi:hypothetical protein
MGYYTSYDITFEGDTDQKNAFKQDLLKESAYSDGRNDSSVVELLETGGVYAKLYDLEGWIDDLAPKYPDLLIIVTGDGEESGDCWEKRWKGKDSEEQCAIIPPFKNPNLQTEHEKSNQ